jgi:hypothetical protein
MGSLPDVTGDIIALGFNCQVRTGDNPSDAEGNVVAMVASFQANEDFQAQEAVCLGNLGPISIDPQGYNCTITLDGFIPSKKVLNAEQQDEGGGKTSIMDIMFKGDKSLRERYMGDGAIPKIGYLDFYNRKDKKVLASFTGVLITSDGINVEGNAYVRNNVQMRALSKN